MNVEIGAEAALFPEKEYINGIAFAVHMIPVRIIAKVRYRVKGLCVVTSSRSTVVCFFLFFKEVIFRYPA
jgi:hypothetical protein